MSGRDFIIGRRRSVATALIPPPDYRRSLLPGEVVRYADRLHPIVLVRPVAIVFGVLVGSGLLVSLSGAGPLLDLFGLVIIGSVGWLAFEIVRWGRRLLVVTDRRVVEVEHLINFRSEIKPVFRQAVIFVQSPIGELLNYGTVMTDTPTGERVHTFKWTHDPRAFYAAVTDRAV